MLGRVRVSLVNNNPNPSLILILGFILGGWQISNKITPKCNTEIFNTKKQTNIPIRLTTFGQNYSELLLEKDFI